MDFTFSSEQEQLRRSVRSIADRHCASGDVRAAMGVDPWDRGLWSRLTEVGLTALGASEEHGGVGATWVEVGVALEESGRALMPVPLLSTTLAVAALDAGEPALAKELLPALTDGISVGAVALHDGSAVTATAEGSLTGTAAYVVDAGIADLFVVAAVGPDGPGLYAVARSAPGVTVTSHATLDQTRGQGTLVLADAPARYAGPGVGRLRDLQAVALAWESVGAARRCLDVTVDYLKTRLQFGRPIGSFQALKHRAADLVVRLESSTSAAYYAGWVADGAPDELPQAAAVAALSAVTAYSDIAAEMIQLHGGIGFTWEHDAHLHFKRATSTRLLLGGESGLRRRVAAAAGLSA